LACQHLGTIRFLLISIVQQPGVGCDFVNVHSMGRRVVTTGGHATAQPNGGIVPFGCTKTLAFVVQHLLPKFNIVH
jgi:hypothetical protein